MGPKMGHVINDNASQNRLEESGITLPIRKFFSKIYHQPVSSDKKVYS